MHDLLHLGEWLNGTATDTRTPTTFLMIAMAGAGLMISEVAPVIEPQPSCAGLWFAVQLLALLALLAVLHRCRPHGPDDPPRSFGESYERVVNPTLVGYVGLLVAGGCGYSCQFGEGGLGTLIFAVLGGLLALGGLAAAVHGVLRRL